MNVVWHVQACSNTSEPLFGVGMHWGQSFTKYRVPSIKTVFLPSPSI